MQKPEDASAARASVTPDAVPSLGRVGPVEVLLARTSRPWSIGVEAIVVSVGVHGPGNLGGALLGAIPSLSLESSFERVTPDAADLIEVNDSAARDLRAVIAISVRDEKLTRAGEADANAETVHRAVRTVLARADAAGVHSLALPMIGGGAVGLNTTLVADAVVGAAVEMLSDATTTLDQLVFICIDDYSAAEVRNAWQRSSDVPKKVVPPNQSTPPNSADVVSAVTAGELSDPGVEPLGKGVELELAGVFASDHVPSGGGGIPLSDELNVDVYVTMLGTLIARQSTAMPISIGLFGEWGSGKSYFMELLRQKVETLAAGASSPGSPYHDDIVQIRFNAWHYADTNLWASLAAEFFDQLNAPSTDTNAMRRHAIKEHLARQNQLRQELEALRQATIERTVQLRENYVRTVAIREQRAHQVSIQLVEVVVRNPEVKANLTKIAGRLGADVTPTQTLQLAEDVKSIRNDAAAARAVLARQRMLVPFVLLLVVLAVTGAALLVPAGLWQQLFGAGAVTTVVALVGSVGALVGRSRQLVGRLRAVAEQAELARATALAEGTADELANLHRAEADEATAKARVDELDAAIAELDRQLVELEPGRRLYQFIADRAKSTDYRGQLGVVSLVRRDFEQLVSMMAEWRAADASQTSGEKPIDRIVLYIDDLDRCEPDQVVEVLQAVHLLLAMELFVVVVGVDPRWLLRALRSRYKGILGEQAVAADDRSFGYSETTPQNYLEKIFQVPLALPTMDHGGFSRLIRHLVASPDSSRSEIVDPSDDSAPTDDRQVGIPPTLQPESGSEVVAAMAATDPTTPERVAEIVVTPITENELDLIARLSALVRTPRAATRLINVYGLLRSARDLSLGGRFLGGSDEPGDYQAVVQLLAILTAAPELLGPILWGDAGADSGPGLCRGVGTSWSAFVDGLAPRRIDSVDGTGWQNDVASTMTEDEWARWQSLVDHLHGLRPYVQLDDLQRYRYWGPQIARFSFLLSPLSLVPPDRLG